jgi:hypothetical protein
METCTCKLECLLNNQSEFPACNRLVADEATSTDDNFERFTRSKGRRCEDLTERIVGACQAYATWTLGRTVQLSSKFMITFLQLHEQLGSATPSFKHGRKTCHSARQQTQYGAADAVGTASRTSQLRARSGTRSLKLSTLPGAPNQSNDLEAARHDGETEGARFHASNFAPPTRHESPHSSYRAAPAHRCAIFKFSNSHPDFFRKTHPATAKTTPR